MDMLDANGVLRRDQRQDAGAVNAVRGKRLQVRLRACTAALQQVSVMLEEAAENLGATKANTVRRIVVPLMTGGILAGFVTSFATASVELSATIMLVNAESDAPLAFGIYEFMQSAAGRGPGAALGIIAVLIVGTATYVSHRVIENIEKKRTAGGLAVAEGTGAAL